MQRSLAAACLAASSFMTQVAEAAPVQMTFATSISAMASDSTGMDGATLSFTFDFADGATYSQPFTVPADAGVEVTGNVMVSGASNGTNDGTYSIAPSSFLTCSPPPAGNCGLFTPGFFFSKITLGNGEEFDLAFYINVGSNAPSVGSFIEADNFAGVASFTFYNNSNNFEGYPLASVVSDVTVTGTTTDPNFQPNPPVGPTTPVPLPASGLLLAGVGVFALRRKTIR